jgi:hypothetical protein
MNRFILLGTATGLFFVGSVSALTMTPTTDNRSIAVSAMAGFDSDSNSDAPGAGFPSFVSDVSANASDIPALTGLLGEVTNGFHGAWASANAGQSSQLGALFISGSGYAEASGSHGDIFPDFTASLGDALTPVDADFQAYAGSVLEILFSIDESAHFDLTGFLSAGTELAVGVNGNDVINRASIILINTDTNTSAYKAEISDDFLEVDASGVIGPGNYRFNVEAYAEVYGAQIFNQTAGLGDAEGAIPLNGYATGAGFKGVQLQLTDQPIPEPVTTSLVGMSLGALALGTSRRRRA